MGARQATSLFEESDAAVAFARRRGWREARAETLAMLDPRTVNAKTGPACDVRTARDARAKVQFTFYWPEAGRWEGEDFRVELEISAAAGRQQHLHAVNA